MARAVAAGELTGALAVDGDVRLENRKLSGTAKHVADGATADEIAVVVNGAVVIVPRAAADVTPVSTIDPTMPLANLSFDGVEISDDRLFSGADAARSIEGAMGEAITAMALSTVATCRRIFEITLDYAKVREQFGKPIGSFQALKHRFANMYLAVEKASSLAYFAALTIAEDDPRRATAPSMAKAAASDCQRLVVTDGLQFHGGIGFTWENDLHFWLKRAKTTDFMFGNGPAHRAYLARALGLAS